jgi:hypothetical protein
VNRPDLAIDSGRGIAPACKCQHGLNRRPSPRFHALVGLAIMALLQPATSIHFAAFLVVRRSGRATRDDFRFKLLAILTPFPLWLLAAAVNGTPPSTRSALIL